MNILPRRSGDRLLKPTKYGMPDKFQDWRPNQEDSIIRALDYDGRFLAQCIPTGSGKSLGYMTVGALDGGRMVVLTQTKALQKQLLDDFGDIGLVEIKGKNSYPCRAEGGEIGCDEGMCNLGYRCRYRERGCAYYDQLRTAKNSRLVVANYAYWLTLHMYRGVNPTKGSDMTLGEVDRLVLDEAHAAPDQMSKIITGQLFEDEVAQLMGARIPHKRENLHAWVVKHYKPLRDLIDAAKLQAGQNDAKRRLALRLNRLKGKLDWIRTTCKDDDWLYLWVKTRKGLAWRYMPIWPRHYAKKYMFREASKVLLVSATVRPKTLELLGLVGRAEADLQDKDLKGEMLRGALVLGAATLGECRFEDYPSNFPVDARRLWWVPTVRVDHKITPAHYRLWLSRIDQIIRKNFQHKGIIHTVSYFRRDKILANSQYRDYMMTHETRDIVNKIKEFKSEDPPAVFVSPSVVTGFDFPYDECRYQVHGKIPFPDTRDPLIAARIDKDPSFPSYMAMQSLVQACGRGTRAPDDWCVNFIIDDHAQWFMKKHRMFAPKWFTDAYGMSPTIPDRV